MKRFNSLAYVSEDFASLSSDNREHKRCRKDRIQALLVYGAIIIYRRQCYRHSFILNALIKVNSTRFIGFPFGCEPEQRRNPFPQEDLT